MTDGQSASLSWCQAHLGSEITFLLLSDSCGFTDVGRPLWREGESVVYNCCWPLRAHSRVRVLGDSWPYFTLSDSRLPQPWGTGASIYIAKEQGDPDILPGIAFPLRRLLWLAGLRWMYMNPPPHRHRSISELLVLVIQPRRGLHRKHLFHYCVSLHCRGNVFTGLFPSSGYFTVACLHSCYLTMGLHVAIYQSSFFREFIDS
jgi:hypothetical protein